MKRTGKTKTTNQYEQLEDRKMLASFSGTPGADVVVINFNGDRPASIEINGEFFENPDSTLEFNVSGDLDDPSDVRDQITLTGGDGHEVRVEYITAATELVVNETTFVRGFTVDDSLQLYTGDGDDFIHASGDRDSANEHNIDFFTEGGDDVVHFLDHDRIELGAGDDRLIEATPEMFSSGTMRGGEGHDSIESAVSFFSFRELNAGELVAVQTQSNGNLIGAPSYTKRYYRFEDFSGTDGSEISYSTQHYTMITGSTAWVYSPDQQGNPLKVNNANQVFGIGGETSVYVHETASPLTIYNSNVNLGGDFQAGDTSRINHEITLNNPGVVVVSNSASTESQNVEVVQAQFEDGSFQHEISGLTPETLILQLSDDSHVNLAGSNTANDHFTVSIIDFHLLMFGNGGDDQFQLVSGFEASANSFVNVIGGEGDDYLEINDRYFSQTYIALQENLIYSPLTTGGFNALSHLEVERTHIIAGELTDKFYISPSSSTQYTITGGKLNQEFAKVFNLVQPYLGTFNFIDLGDSKYTWYFGENGPLFVHFRYHSPDV